MTAALNTDASTSATGAVGTPDLADRLETIAWGLVFLLFGAIALPSGTLEYVAVTAVGVGLLALNGFRVAAHVEVGWFSVVLGATAVVAGAAALGGVPVNDVAVFFGLAGAVLIVGAILRPRRDAED